MSLRKAFLILAGTMLWLGPVLAGLANLPYTVIAFFAGAFLLWLVALRPTMWRRATEAGALTLARRIVVIAAVQALLSLLAYWFGRGIGQILDLTLPLPIWLPPAQSLLGAALAPIIMPPRRAAEMDAFIEDAIRQIEGVQAEAIANREAQKAARASAPAAERKDDPEAGA